MVLLILTSLLTPCRGVLFPYGEEHADSCLRTRDPLVPCLVSGAVHWLEETQNHQIRIADDLHLDPDLEELPAGGDPREMGTLMETLEQSLSSRKLIWEMDWLYPGLTMVVARKPISKLFFTLDQRRSLSDHHISTGGLVVKRAVLPLLLGIQLKTAALVPLLLAALVLIAKKAFFLSKLSILLTGYNWFQKNQQYGSYGAHQYQDYWGRRNVSQPLNLVPFGQ